MRNWLRCFKRRLTGRLVPLPPVTVRHAELTMLFSEDDAPSGPDDFLLDVAVRAIERARTVSMSDVVARMKAPPFYPEVWPGEHYKLLAALVQELQPRLVVEIGTSSGLSALAMLHSLPQGARLLTFDLIPWQRFPDTVLTTAEFSDGRLEQVIADLGDPDVFRRWQDLLQDAAILFIDGPKDASFEERFLSHLDAMPFMASPLLVFDDIRVWNMLSIWRQIRRPKLDLTSFGHWSGTGLVHWIPL